MPMNYYYGFDYTWYLLVLPAFLLALWAQLRVKTTYAKYSKIRSVRGRTAAEVARQILNDHGLTYVRVDQIAGELTDNYDPRTNVVHLSQGVYNSTSIPIFFVGLLLNFTLLMSIGILLFGLVTLFQLITLPVEFNASRRALATIEERGLLTGDETRGARRVLSAAALTYVAALASSLAQLLRLVIISRGRNRD